jgi:NAD-dependent SIR2 family protein deacetylase
VPEELLVEAHGSYRRAHCVGCGKEADISIVQKAIFGGAEPAVPRCPACPRGVLKPQCTFFGEKLPSRFWKERTLLSSCSVLLVEGTSLQVEPFASLVDEVRPDCVRVLLNRELVGPFAEGLRDARSFALLGDVETTVAALAAALGWQL